MRRRLTRGRRGRASDEGRTEIDAAQVLPGLTELLRARSLEAASDAEIPGHYALLAKGESEGGSPLLAAFSPSSGGDALLAAVSHALGQDGPYEGEVVAVAPQWDGPARRRLGLLRELAFPFRALAAPALAEGGEIVRGDVPAAPALLPVERLADAFERLDARTLFARALATFEGLAAKHGGAVRGVVGGVEILLLARRVAVLREEEGGVILETFLPDRATIRLESGELATAMDRLEGQLRKRLNDRRIRSSEEGLRASLLSILSQAGELQGSVFWPLPGADPEVLDLAGINARGEAGIGVVRAQLTLEGLGAILDATLDAIPLLPALLSQGERAIRSGQPALLIAAREFDRAALRVLPALRLASALYDVRDPRGQALGLVLRESDSTEALTAVVTPEVEREEGARPERSRSPEVEREEGARPERSRSRGRRSRRGARGSSASGSSTSGSSASRSESDTSASAGAPSRYEEISLFDLEDDAASGGASEESSGRRSRRGRGRRRRRPREEGERGEGDSMAPEAPLPEGGKEPVAEPARRGSRRGPRTPEPVSATQELDEDDVDDVTDTLTPLLEDVPEIAEAEPSYDDDEDLEGAPAEEKPASEAATPAAEEHAAPERRAPRRRAALVVHADRDSVLAAILLARDLRLLEGFWVYPQSELMTFFRSVATDLRDDTPIHVVGFTASPARETIQAASLYADRLDWYDHHDWPPEDLGALRAQIGEDRVHVQTGAGSSLPTVLVQQNRRSRFSDKLLELATGSFTQHDYERWGGLWWHRIGEVCRHTGEQRAAIDKLLAGRPSDLAREAADVAPPPPPPEVEYVSRRDFRLVHFGGYTLVVVPTPPEFDVYLTARVARERYAAQLSLAYSEGSERVLLGAEELRGRGGLDLGRMVEHLAAKHDYIEVLADLDHVARVRVRGLLSNPERLDEVIAEVAMGRSILEA